MSGLAEGPVYAGLGGFVFEFCYLFLFVLPFVSSILYVRWNK